MSNDDYVIVMFADSIYKDTVSIIISLGNPLLHLSNFESQ